VEEYFIIAGLAIIVQQAKKPFYPVFVSDFLGRPALLAATCAKYNIKVADCKIIKEVYNKIIPG
jgi:hypothetical protein